ncbi:acidic phospholipase A2-like isoform 1-T1 [Anomaloglossus baeobatrachus]|uniref:acidic phospholipase A2-like n=1 Tax=Anomaloglossus baeobatrachus TaxID=238106 RepID=UPI003F50A561
MVFSWIFPVCLRGTMLSSLLLLLSLVSVEKVKYQLKDFKMMINETLNKEMIEALPWGCACAETANNQTMHKITRCCQLQRCCHLTFWTKICRPYLQLYYYTYSNGVITCDHSVFMTDCARNTCECDRKTVMCLMDPEYSESKYSESCSLGPLACSKIKKWASFFNKT